MVENLENLLNHQKFSKFYEHDCLQNLIFLFMSLLTALIVKNNHILSEIYFIFLLIYIYIKKNFVYKD